MRKILVFLLLLSVFLLAVIIDWNVRRTSESIRSSTAPAEIRDDDVFELLIGYPPGENRGRKLSGGSREPRLPPGSGAGEQPATRSPEPPPPIDPAPPREDRPRRYLYTVEEDDTLTSIAKKLFDDETAVKQLIEWNNLKDPDKIYPGQKLRYYR